MGCGFLKSPDEIGFDDELTADVARLLGQRGTGIRFAIWTDGR